MTEPATLEEFVEQRRDRDLPTEVYVSGSGRHFPEDIEATAREVAEMITHEDGDVLESGYDQLGEGDVALFEVSQDIREQIDDVHKFRELANVARASSYAGIVVYTNGVDTPKTVLQVIDAVVEVNEDGVEFVGRVRTDFPGGDFYKVELDALVAGGDA